MMMTMDECEKTQDLSQMRCEMTSSVKECPPRARSTHGVHHAIVVKSIPLNTENWLRKLYDKNYNNDTSNEGGHETNYSMNNDTRNMHIT